MDYKVKTIESPSELREIFGKITEPKLLLESDQESPNQYKLISTNLCTIGIIDHSFGVPMQIEGFTGGDFVLIGHESRLDCVSLKNAALKWHLKLDSVFFQFKEVCDVERIVVIEETGFLAVDYLGRKIWNHATDIISHFEITNSYVYVKTIEGIELKVSTRTGEILAMPY